jgi:hypothetical protein
MIAELSTRAAVHILPRQIDEVLLAEAAFRLRQQAHRSAKRNDGRKPYAAQARYLCVL